MVWSDAEIKDATQQYHKHQCFQKIALKGRTTLAIRKKLNRLIKQGKLDAVKSHGWTTEEMELASKELLDNNSAANITKVAKALKKTLIVLECTTIDILKVVVVVTTKGW